MDLFTSSPEARRLFVASIVARLPPAMISIGLLVHARQQTGSFAAAGVVAGAYAIGLGIGGPPLGRLVDRRGQTTVLLASAGIAAVLLVTIALLPATAPPVVLVALAAGVGAATPPVGACLRTQLPALLSDPRAARGAFALETSLVELTYIFGPPVALCVGASWSSAAALAAAGLALLATTAVFAAQGMSRSWHPVAVDPMSTAGSLRAPAMRTLVIVLAAVGVLLGADEVAVIAVATSLHTTAGGAPMFAVWGTGSFIGGLLATRLGGGARTTTGLALLLGLLTVGHLVLIPADRSVFAFAAVLLVAGAAIAPTEASLYAMVQGAAPVGTVAEAFAWLGTAMAVGSAAGAAGAGLLADVVGPAAAIALGGGAGVFAVLTCVLRSPTINVSTPPAGNPAAAISMATGGQTPSGRQEDSARLEEPVDAAHNPDQPYETRVVFDVPRDRSCLNGQRRFGEVTGVGAPPLRPRPDTGTDGALA